MSSEQEQSLTDTDRRDRDETRRLLYMALVAPRTKRYNLAGTIINAIRHHQQVDISTEELIDRAVGAVEGEAGHSAWLYEQIDRLTAELGE